MNTMSDSEFAEYMMDLAKDAGEFKPTATYDPDGDCIEFLAKPGAFYGERVDDLVTVYYSFETHEIVGSLIKGVRGFCKKIGRTLPGFANLKIEHGRVRLNHFFLVGLLVSDSDPDACTTTAYKKLIDIAETCKVETELCAV